MLSPRSPASLDECDPQHPDRGAAVGGGGARDDRTRRPRRRRRLRRPRRDRWCARAPAPEPDHERGDGDTAGPHGGGDQEGAAEARQLDQRAVRLAQEHAPEREPAEGPGHAHGLGQRARPHERKGSTASGRGGGRRRGEEERLDEHEHDGAVPVEGAGPRQPDGIAAEPGEPAGPDARPQRQPAEAPVEQRGTQGTERPPPPGWQREREHHAGQDGGRGDAAPARQLGHKSACPWPGRSAIQAGMPTPWYAAPAKRDAAEPGHGGVDARRPQEVVDPVLGEGVGMTHDDRLLGRSGDAHERSELLPGPVGDLVVPPSDRARVVDPAERGPQQHLSVAGQVRPLAVQEGAGGDRPCLAALVRAAARHQEAGPVQWGRDVSALDAERRHHHRGVVDRLQQAGRFVVVVLQERRRGRRRRGEHDRIRPGRLAGGPHGPGVSGPFEPFGRSREPDVDLPLPQARRQRLHQRRHAALERPEEGRARRVRSRDLGPQSPHEAAAALGGGQQRREGRRRGHVVDRAGVDAADERVDQDIDDLVAQLARHQGPDGAVPDRAPDVGAGQHGIAGQAQHAARAEDPGAGRRPEPGGDARARAPRAARAGVPGPRPMRHGPRSASACRRAPAPCTGRSPRAGAPGTRRGPCRRSVPRRRSLRKGPPRLGDASSSTTVGASLPALGTTGQLPGRGQAADAATDDDHPARRHVRWRRPRRRSRRPARR